MLKPQRKRERDVAAVELERRLRQAVKPDTLFVWFTLTFKLRLGRKRHHKRVRLPARQPLVRNVRVLNAAEPDVKMWKIAAVDDEHVLSARPDPKVLSPLYAVEGVAEPARLPENEPVDAAVRVLNFCGSRLLGNRSRRRTNPERLVSVVAVHDFNPRTFTRKPRPDVHSIVALPERVSFSEFERQWHQAVKREQRRFVYKRVDLQRVEHLARVVDYCANPKKSEAGNPIAYVHLPTEPTE
jgi:hypothetical protein